MEIWKNAPQYIKDILEHIESEGHEAYMVGGCVRDFLIGLTPKDYDISTCAPPEKIIEIFKEFKGDWYVDVIPTGIQHGTVSVIVKEKGRNVSVEVTTFRYDGEYEDSRRPKAVTFTQSIVEDLKRRDFTINAMAYSPNKGYIDVFGGMDDIRAGIVRCVGSPDERFKEDGLRILRAVRFAVSLGFSIEHNTFVAAKSDGYLLEKISKERIRDELTKMIISNEPSKSMVIMKGLGILQIVVPELESTFSYNQNSKYHRYDLFTHTLKTLEFAHSLSYSLPNETRLLVKLAAILHDVGKPMVRTSDSDGVVHYRGHEEASGEIAHRYLKRYRFDNITANRVQKLIVLHMKIMKDERMINEINSRRLISKFSEEELSKEVDLMGALFVLQISDTLGKGVNYDERVEMIERFRALTYKELELNSPVREKDLALNGMDLIGLGIEKGKEIGDIKRQLMEAVIEDPTKNNRQDLVDIAKSISKSSKSI